MVKFYQCYKTVVVFIITLTFSTTINAQQSRLPNQQELDVKESLLKLYKGNTTARLAPNHLAVTGPEQDCDNAIPVCQQSYTQTTSYTGNGSIQEVNGTCLSTQETNSVWYVFTVQNSGTFTFMLNTANDYDFALYDITSIGCSGVPSATPVRCNFSATYGSTGLTLPASASTNLSVPASGAPTMAGLNVNAGQTFVLIVDNFSANTNGYTLTFGGTAQIFDNTPPTISSSNFPCNGSSIRINFSEPVSCSSIAANGSDFTITGPSGSVPVTSAVGNLCSTGASNTNYATLNFNNAGLPSGTYTVSVVTGTDGNTLIDKCGNNMAGQTVTFQYLAPVTVSATATSICAGSPTTLSVTVPGSPAGLTYVWSPSGATTPSITVNPSSNITYVVNVTYAGCSRSASQTITITQPPVVSVNPTNVSLCSGTTAIIASATIGGSVCSTCSYTWSGSASQTDNSVPSSTLTGVGSGTYNVTVSTNNGCLGNTAVSNVAILSPSTPPSCDIVYASPAGGGTGLTPASPTDIQTALTMAACNNIVIKMQIGDYTVNNPLNVNSYITMEGGYNTTFTLKTSGKATSGGFPAQGTRIIRSTSNVEGSAGSQRYTAINVVGGSSYFRIQDIMISMPNNSAGTAISNYGIYLGSGCNNYNITRCQINSGDAGSGVAGAAATGTNTPGSPGGPGGSGGNGNSTTGSFGDGGAEGNGATSTHASMFWNFLGGASNGASTIAAENANGGIRSGGEGGAGGSGGYYDEDGGNGSPGGAGGGGALGGTPPANSGGWWDCGWAAIMDGFNGNPGAAGANGAVGAAGPAGTDASGYWVPGGPGGVGGDGAGGGGGSGAGGGAGDGGPLFCFNSAGTGGGGGAGGGGGQGGVGGNGGTGGGATFGIFIFNNGANGNVVDCQVNLGTAGAGGVGGAGTTGANGGAGGTRGCADACTGSGEGNGGTGGAGGKGGNGGQGGSGAAGTASAVRLVGGSALVTNSATFTLTTQPVIVVDNKSCTNVNIAHTYTAAATWSSFGTSASPASGSGSPSSTAYSTTGRKTVVMNTSNYTDFNNIIVNPPSTGNIIASASTICPGAANFISSVAGTAGFTYSWTALPVGGTINSASSSSTSITFANAGVSPITYTVSLTITSQCCGTLTPITQTIVVYPNPANPAASVNAICVGGVATFTANTPVGSSFSWYNAASSGTLLATGNTYSIGGVSTPTTVYLQATNAGGCTSSLTAVPVTPTVIPDPSALSATSCDPGLVQVGITPAAGVTNYNWYSDPGGTTLVQSGTSLNYSQNIAASGGSYVVYVQSNIPGCTPGSLIPVTGSVTGTPIVANSAITANDTVCENTPVTITLNPSGGSGSYSYAWSPVTSTVSSITQTVTSSIGYNVIVTSGNCSKQFNFPIIVNPYPFDTIATPMVISCTNPTISLDGSLSDSGPSTTYSWTTSGGTIVSGTNTNTLDVSGPGTYSLTVSNNSTGCASVYSVNVSGNTTVPSLTLTPTIYTLTCATPTVALNAASSTASVSYAWSTSGGILTGTNVPNPVASAAGTYSVVLTNTVNGCQASGTLTLVPDATIPSVTITATSLTLTCNSAIESVSVNVSPSSDITYAWSPSPASGGSGTNPTFDASGTYTCVITNTVNSCATSVQVTVSSNTVTPSATITPSQTLTCATPSAAISTTVNPASGVTYSWSGPGVTGQSTSTVSVTQAGVYDVLITDAANGCTTTATSNVTSNIALPTITVSPTTTTITCSTTTISLNASSSSTLAPVWSIPTGTASNPVVANAAGDYIVTVTDDANGCVASQTITISSDTNPPAVSAGALTPIACGSTTATLNGSSTPSAGVIYTWDGPTVTSIISGSNTANPVIGEIGQYTLTAVGPNGCSASATVAVIQGSVNAQFTANPMAGTAPLDIDFTDQSVGGITYNWNFGDGNSSTSQNPANTYTLSGTYTVALIVSSGLCVDTAYAVIIVEDGLNLEIPNVFTPNGDGSNDLFTIKSSGVKSIDLQIFNRWGEKLYEFSGDKAAWDGKVQSGALVPAGTYFYFVKATGFDQKEIEKHGTLNLFR